MRAAPRHLRRVIMMVQKAILASILAVAAPLNAQDFAYSADSIMKAAASNGFSGVVLVAKNGSVVFEKGYGLANRAEKIPFTPQTVVQIGSNTKDFTAVAILQLKDRGLLDLQDKLSRFFPGAPEDKKDITVWQLMTHKAGFPLGLGSDFAPMSRQMLIDSAMAFKLLFPPGTRESYSNTGYALLAAIIEKVSGKTYDEYVRDNILTPLGLKHTGFLLPGFADPDLAHGYRTNGEDAGTMLSKAHAPDGPYWNLRGNGGMLSTVGDMHAFYRALFETDKLLKPETRNLRFDPTQPIGLAGSDMINFFLYERVPEYGIEMIIASTNAAMKAPMVRRELAKAAGLPDVGGPQDAKEAEAPLARATGKPPSAGAAAVIDEFVATFNKGDKAAMQKFIEQHYLLPPDQPAAAQRAERFSGLRSDLGTLDVIQKTVVDDGSVQVIVKSEREGQAMLIFDMEQAAPFRIRRFGIQVGG